MSQLFINPEMKEYMLTVLASNIQGVNNEEKFRIWIGEGANGKSKLNELMQLAFGEYCYKFPITLLTQKRAKSNQASPEVVGAKGKRYCYFEEPDENEKINTGLMKEFSGNDKVKGRGLYCKELVEFKPQWKMHMLSNHMLELPAHEKSVWRRVEAIEYGSYFTYDPKEPNEFPRDDHLSAKLEEWKQAFMYILIKYHKKYVKYGIKVPDQVTAFTKKYEQENDKYSEFTLRYLERTGNMDDKLEMDQVYEEFKFWHGDANGGARLPSKREAKKYFDKALGKNNVTLSEVFGYRFAKCAEALKKKHNDEEDPFDVEGPMFSNLSSSNSSVESSYNEGIQTNIKKIKVTKTIST